MINEEIVEAEEIRNYCKLMARLFKKIAIDIDVNSIKFCLEDVIDEGVRENLGDITVIWRKKEENTLEWVLEESEK